VEGRMILIKPFYSVGKPVMFVFVHVCFLVRIVKLMLGLSGPYVRQEEWHNFHGIWNNGHETGDHSTLVLARISGKNLPFSLHYLITNLIVYRNMALREITEF
jgi:hypothetical protein